MKEILNIDNMPTVLLNSIDDNSIIGILWSNNEKSFIRHSELGFCSVELGTKLILSNKWTTPTIKEYLQHSYLIKGSKAYLFESYEELFDWLKGG